MSEQPRPCAADVFVCGFCANRWGADAWSNDCKHAATLRAALPIVRAIIAASDGCAGHAACNHAMTPWRDARALLAKIDAAEPTP